MVDNHSINVKLYVINPPPTAVQMTQDSLRKECKCKSPILARPQNNFVWVAPNDVINDLDTSPWRQWRQRAQRNRVNGGFLQIPRVWAVFSYILARTRIYITNVTLITSDQLVNTVHECILSYRIVCGIDMRTIVVRKKGWRGHQRNTN